jgi:hypothetical protein
MPIDFALELILEVGVVTGNITFALRVVLNSPIGISTTNSKTTALSPSLFYEPSWRLHMT